VLSFSWKRAATRFFQSTTTTPQLRRTLTNPSYSYPFRHGGILSLRRVPPTALFKSINNSMYSQFPIQNCLKFYSTTPTDDVVFELNAVNIRPTLTESPKPFVMYCTAEWCGPCKKLSPKLEKDIRAFNGKVRLGRLDVDKEQQIAADLRIQSIPAVFAFFKGKLLNSFVGIPDDKTYQDFLNSIDDVVGDKDSEATLATAEEHLQNGEIEQASKLFGDVFDLQNQNNNLNGALALSGLIRCLIKQGNENVARDLVRNLQSNFKECLNNSTVKASITALELLEQSGDSSGGNIEELEKIVANDPTRLQEKYSLASLYASQSQHQKAINLLIEIIKKDRHWNEDAARELCLKIFEALGPTHPQTISGRQRLTSVWFN